MKESVCAGAAADYVRDVVGEDASPVADAAGKQPRWKRKGPSSAKQGNRDAAGPKIEAKSQSDLFEFYEEESITASMTEACSISKNESLTKEDPTTLRRNRFGKVIGG